MAAVAVSMPRSIGRPGPYSRGAEVQPLKPIHVPIRASSLAPAERANEDPGVLYTCSSLAEWLSPEADNYQGMRVPRALDPRKWQSLADQLEKEFRALQLTQSDNERVDCFRKGTIEVGGTDATRQQRIQDAALAISSSLPPALAKLVYQDVLDLADTICKLVPGARRLLLKLDLFSYSVCARWHLDQYVCRSIVSYNCSGTQYTADSNVNFDELLYCGKADHIIRDNSRIHSVDVGDIMMIKGTKFPGKAKSLVHKSPEIRHHDNGNVQTRMLLKVDVMDVA